MSVVFVKFSFYKNDVSEDTLGGGIIPLITFSILFELHQMLSMHKKELTTVDNNYLQRFLCTLSQQITQRHLITLLSVNLNNI